MTPWTVLKTARRAIRILVLFIPLASASLLDWPSFGSKHRNRAGQDWSDESQDFNLNKVGGALVGWLDWNGDTYLDAVMLANDRRTISIYVWNHDSFTFEALGASLVAPQDVVNVVAGDWNHDGRPDLLVMSKDNAMDNRDTELQLSIYLGSPNGTSFDSPIGLPSSSMAQPIAYDFTGDFRTDLLGIPFSASTLGLDQLRIWQNEMSTTSRQWTLQKPNLTSIPTCQFDGPHTSATIDLDGDCLPDLFLICKSSPSLYAFQAYINKKQDGFMLAASGTFPSGFGGTVSFADFDRDGTMDMLFPVCSGSVCSIHVVYNNQIPICSSPTRTDCRGATELCQGDPGWNFNFSQDASNAGYQIIPTRNILGGNQIVMTDEAFPYRPSQPLHLQIGDYNIDAFPDILLLHTPDGSRSMIGLLENVPCDEQSCGKSLTEAGRRTLQRVDSAIFDKYDTVRSASWVDIDEDGTLDILIQLGPMPGFFTSPVVKRDLVFILNNLFHDAFFVKAYLLNGACGSRCSLRDGSGQMHLVKPFGSPLPGSTFKYSLLDARGARRASQVAQASSSVYNALQLPYAFFGLGRTNNYVEKLFVGSTAHQASSWAAYEGVIPNAQLIINPYQPQLLDLISKNVSIVDGLVDVGAPSSWIREIYVRPSDYIGWVTLCAVTLVILLSTLVIILQTREKRMDERQRKRGVHSSAYQSL